MTDFMHQHNISIGTLALSHNGKCVYHRSFGWQDQQCTHPIHHDAAFRIASCAKPLTAAAIRLLVQDGLLSLQQAVFDCCSNVTGLLPNANSKERSAINPRLSQITIDHLLTHKAGWDKQLACDLTYQEQLIKTELNLQRPATAEEFTCWATSHPLQHNPGSVYTYFNLGYLCLGLVIQRISNTSLLVFLQQRC